MSKRNDPVDAILHKTTRKNIPTQELRDFVREPEPERMLYPRDPSLDPQLVWKGKDAQDAGGLAVDVLHIYIQETVEPRAIVENVRAEVPEEERQVGLFSAFEKLPFEARVEFYQHPGDWTNRLILGDSLLVLTSLAEKEGLKGMAQMVYMDPPYGIEFGSNWQVSTRKRKVDDGKLDDLTRQPEQIRAFRDTWKLGIHSYLAYLRDRFTVAHMLLSESGSIFVQIGDENAHLVRSVLDEVFGSECHVVTIVVKKKGSQKSTLLDPVNDYILWYSRSPRSDREESRIKFRALWEKRELDAETLGEFKTVELPGGRVFDMGEVPAPDGVATDYRLRPKQLFKDHPNARLFRPWPITNGGSRPNQMDEIEFDGRSFPPPKGNCWRHTTRTSDGSVPGMTRIRWAKRLIPGKTALDYKRYLDDFPYKMISNWWDGLGGAPDQVYVVQTNEEIVKRCLLMTTDPGDLVIDPTCGSGTTAFVAEQWGRRWITSDTSRVALALARTRMMAATYPYYLLLDSTEGRAKEGEVGGTPPNGGAPTGDIRKGFILKRVNRVTSGSIASNPDIREGMDGERLDAAIRRHGEPVYLFDEPYPDGKRVRVAGPFTVESLSPHRMLVPAAEGEEAPANRDETEFVEMVIEHLRRSGVQNTKKEERLEFSRLVAITGGWLQAAGEYTDGEGKARRVAVSIGPEHGTVGPDQVKEAAKEAVQGRGYDLLIVCGFAFDPHVSQESKRFGGLTVLPTRMNADLAMGPDVLKNTGAGNLFMVFGEPDISFQVQADGKLVVNLNGLNIYDPTTGEVRDYEPDEIACWFLDTRYNGESFYVRHAYFTGARDPYVKLKRALRAEIDEEAWASLRGTTSRPFSPPSTGKFAVKVINHYGDEVMKVFEVKSAGRRK